MSYKQAIVKDNNSDRSILHNEIWKPLHQSIEEYLSTTKANYNFHNRKKDFQYHFQDIYDELTKEWFEYGYFSKSTYDMFSKQLLKSIIIVPKSYDIEDHIENENDNDEIYE